MIRLFAIAVTVISLCAASPASRSQSNGEDSAAIVPGHKSPYKGGQREESNGDSELFAFPADQSTIEANQNARNRTPVYLPKRCLENEILYPGDQESDWVCDCKPTFVYHPPTRQCYEMYTQGYCEYGYMIYLVPGGKHPECIKNDCADRPPPSLNSSLVLYNGECVVLNEYHQNCTIGKINRIIGINEKTHELDCLDISVVKLHETTTVTWTSRRMSSVPKRSVS
ncbi:uncharacterized protein LOC129763643 [Toxorhynchites rutilus septentrionalis]|uniref:uncharacterized protein LOC129763643 n=1 Tax=Toxorhynchites rutilus septentrionalis TaxID=329112 RepID=UPI00247AE215|nr:uncharacterized protein LOC129763643 [Toxorhynchites rutilus septentrionalis]